jgi:hypothetical protein
MNEETYYESAEDITISRNRALRELANHCITSEDEIMEFFEDMGDKDSYSAQSVLNWLGY